MKSFIIALAVVVTFAGAPVAHGATNVPVQAQIKMWEAYIVKLEAVIRLCEKQIALLEGKEEVIEAPVKVEKVYVYTVTLPTGSPVKQPKEGMTFEELRIFTANLFPKFQSAHNRLLTSTEPQVVDFLKTNGYVVERDRI